MQRVNLAEPVEHGAVDGVDEHAFQHDARRRHLDLPREPQLAGSAAHETGVVRGQTRIGVELRRLQRERLGHRPTREIGRRFVADARSRRVEVHVGYENPVGGAHARRVVQVDPQQGAEDRQVPGTLTEELGL